MIDGGGSSLLGRQLGQYRLEAALGDGAFGRVYRARHAVLNVDRAVKVMQADIALDPQYRERFLREARTAAQLHHPNIVTVVDSGTEGDIQYLVMEYVESETLAERLARMPVPGRLGDPAARQWIADIGAGLDHAHAAGVVHRDLKPANVLVRAADRRAMLTDFGIAQVRTDSKLTAHGHSVGTYAYMSPEQCEGSSDLTSACDVYAFAAVLYEIATGEPPFGRGVAAVSGHMTRPMPPLRLQAPELPDGLDAVLAKGLAKASGDRHRTAGELAAACLGAVPGHAAAADQSDVTVRSAPAWTPPETPVIEEPVPADTAGTWSLPVPRLPMPSLGLVVAVAAGLIGVTLVVAVVRAATPGPIPQPVPAAPAASPQGPAPPAVARAALPAPVQGAVGSTMRVAGVQIKVVSVTSGGQPSPPIDAADRFLLVSVRYQAGDGGTSTSPYDWAITDGSDRVYTPVVDGVRSPLPERGLAAHQARSGQIGFVVPRSARGLVLHFDAAVGDDGAQVALPS